MRTLTAHETAVLDSLVRHARPAILTEFQPDSCIASTRIGMDVLDFFGLRTIEVAVRVAVFNAEAVRLLEQGISMEALGDHVRAIPASQQGGPWTLGLGAENPNRSDGNGWPGHLVIGHPDTGVLIDLSADQASRPHKNMTLRPAWYVINDQEWWDDKPVQAITTTDEVLMAWSRNPQGGTTYRASPNWRRTSSRHGSSVFKRLTGQIIRQVRQDLAQST